MKIWAILSVLLLVGCGYRPLYGNVSETLNNVHVASVEVHDFEREAGSRRIAQYLQQELGRRFTGSAAARYHLSLRVKEILNDVAVRRDATVQRQSLVLEVTAVLRDMDTDTVLLQRRLSESSAFNADLTPLGTDAGRDQARRSAAGDIEMELLNRVGLVLHQHRNK